MKKFIYLLNPLFLLFILFLHYYLNLPLSAIQINLLLLGGILLAFSLLVIFLSRNISKIIYHAVYIIIYLLIFYFSTKIPLTIFPNNGIILLFLVPIVLMAFYYPLGMIIFWNGWCIVELIKENNVKKSK